MNYLNFCFPDKEELTNLRPKFTDYVDSRLYSIPFCFGDRFSEDFP
jgi:hypothetical protein